jgi:hypothetical protein
MTEYGVRHVAGKERYRDGGAVLPTFVHASKKLARRFDEVASGPISMNIIQRSLGVAFPAAPYSLMVAPVVNPGVLLGPVSFHVPLGRPL